MFALSDGDAHNLLLVRLSPSDMCYSEAREYIHPEKKVERAQTRKEGQKANKRKGQQHDDDDDQGDNSPTMVKEAFHQVNPAGSKDPGKKSTCFCQKKVVKYMLLQEEGNTSELDQRNFSKLCFSDIEEEVYTLKRKRSYLTCSSRPATMRPAG